MGGDGDAPIAGAPYLMLSALPLTHSTAAAVAENAAENEHFGEDSDEFSREEGLQSSSSTAAPQAKTIARRKANPGKNARRPARLRAGAASVADG